MSSKVKVVIVTNVPPPYRIPAWRLLAETVGIDLHLVFCAQPYIDTSLSPADYGFNCHFLGGHYKIMDNRFNHCNLKVWTVLNRLQPDVLITTGYVPTFLFAFAWAIVHRVPHIAMTDGTFDSEKVLSWLHKLVRHIVLNLSRSFVGASLGSQTLFKSYGIATHRIHLSCLCTDNSKFNHPHSAQPMDLLFCGRFIALKRPLFALEVAKQTAIRLQRRVSINLVGSGILEPELHAYAAEIAEYVDCHFSGYASQSELPLHYANARLFLFPTENDTWGVVANEACAAGLPVIITPHAGAAGELVVDKVNGFVCTLDIAQWTDAVVTLLNDPKLYAEFSANSQKQVSKYNFENAAHGLLAAINQAIAHKTAGSKPT